MEHQIHFGKKFYLDKNTGYWICTNKKKIRAHRWVWINHYGEIEKGFHIHHKDGDKSNNSIENLEKISAFDHLSLHASLPENVERSRKWCNEIRPLTKEWHKSVEGKKWHKEHSLKNNFGNPIPTCYKCQQCGKDYQSKLIAKGRTRFCSNACKSTCRRLSGIDNIEKKCPICNKNYIQNKYAKAKTCGKICGKIFQSQISRK
jgi:hypothetical protein